MPAPLRDTVARLAQDFATQILAAIRSASLEEVAQLSGKRGPARAEAAPSAAAPRRAAAGRAGGRRRRSAEDIAALGSDIVSLLQSHPEGLRAEQIREQLGVPRKELPRALTEIVSSGAARKEGAKRATTYFVGEGGGAAGGRRGKRRAGKRSSAKKGGKRGGRRKAQAAAEG